MFQYAILDAPMLLGFMVIGFKVLALIYHQVRMTAIWHPDNRWHGFIDMPAVIAPRLIASFETLTKPEGWAFDDVPGKEENFNPYKMNTVSLVFYSALLILAIDYAMVIWQYLHTGAEFVQYECELLVGMMMTFVMVKGYHLLNHGKAMGLNFRQSAKKVLMKISSLLLIIPSFVYCYTEMGSDTTVMGDLIYMAPPGRLIADYQAPTVDHSCATDVKCYYEALLHFDASQAGAVGLTAQDLQDCQKFAGEQYQITQGGSVLQIEREGMPQLEVPLADIDSSATVIKQAAMKIQMRSQIKVQEKYRWRARSQATISVETFDFPVIVKGVIDQTAKQAAAGAFANRAERQAYFALQLQKACAASAPSGIATQTIDCLYDDSVQHWFPARGNLQGLWLELSNKMIS